jgi:hypothetical protein
MGRDHPEDLEEDGWMIIKRVLRKTMCEVICRSVVSSGGLLERSFELPDFTQAGKCFASSLIINFFTGDPCQVMDNPRIVDAWQGKEIFLFSKKLRPAL